jgi:hypothetical protein
MEKETKIVLGVVALGVVGYYLWNKSKKVVKEKPKDKEVATTKDFQVPKECPKGFVWKKINCVNEPCPSACMQIQEELTEEQKYYARNPIFVTQDEYVPVLDVPQFIISPQDAARMQALRSGGLRVGFV